MDNPRRHPHARRASMFLESIERRDAGRHLEPGQLVMLWHHNPETTVRYTLLDLSGTGARVQSESLLPEGMTGVALSQQPGDVGVNRIAMVAWSRNIRNSDGQVTHSEAGIRFI